MSSLYCIDTNNKILFCGQNNYRRLGVGDINSRTNFIEVSSSRFRTIALDKNGSTWNR